MQKQAELIPLTLNGDLRRGGWLCNFRVQGDTDAISRGQNIRLMGKALADHIDLASREFLNAHALAAPDFRFSRHASQGTFQAGTVDAFLRGESIQDLSFSNQASPANSHEVNGLNFGEIVTHILQKHTNYIYDATGAAGSPDGVVTSTNIDTTNSTGLDQFIIGQSNNLWSVLQRIAGGEEGGGEFYRIYVTRANKIIYEQAPPFVSPQPAAKGTLTKSHLRGNVQVKFWNAQPGQRVGQVQITAVKNATTVYTSSYPANPADGKIFKKLSGIWANSQARADVLSERLYRWLTRSYKLTIEVDPGLMLFGDDGTGLDLGDRVLLTYDGPTEDTDTGAGVHLNLSAQSLFVYGANVQFKAHDRSARATLILEHDNSA